MNIDTLEITEEELEKMSPEELLKLCEYMLKGHHRVYFAKCKDYIKIGSTIKDFPERLSSIQTGNPFPVIGLGIIACDCSRKKESKGAKCEKETKIQSMFQHSKIEWLPRTEWFHITPELLNYIEKHAKKSSPDGQLLD